MMLLIYVLQNMRKILRDLLIKYDRIINLFVKLDGQKELLRYYIMYFFFNFDVFFI